MSDHVPASPLDDLDRCGPYSVTANRLAGVKSAIAARGWPLLEFTPGPAGSRETWLCELGKALSLPAHFGANFDALYDSLCDRDLLPQPALVLIFSDTSALGEDGTDTLIAVLQAAADEWREQDRRLWALFSQQGADLDPLPQK